MKTNLNIRIEESLKIHIDELALKEDMTTSEFTREILESHFSYETDDEIEIDRDVVFLEMPFHKTENFFLLIIWLLSRVHCQEESCDTIELTKIRQFIEDARGDAQISQELKWELLKVLNDINSRLFDSDITNSHFWFCYPNNMYSLNYSILIKELWKLKG